MPEGGQEARAAVTDALRDATLTKPQFGVVDDQASNAVDLSTDMWRALTKIRVIEKPLGAHAGQYKDNTMTASSSPKRLLSVALITCAGWLLCAQAANSTPAPNASGVDTMQLTQEWDKTFPQSTKVDHQKVTFKNRYGITLAADLYLPKNRDNQKLAAIAVSGPFGAVKEQSSGLYAQTMAERGFVTLAFDPSYTGESGGEPRNLASPEINTEYFSAAVDCLGLLPFVDRQRIGIIGVCGFGGDSQGASLHV